MKHGEYFHARKYSLKEQSNIHSLNDKTFNVTIFFRCVNFD